MSEPVARDFTRRQFPPGFRPRRGLNWFILGLMYATYYMCRYNFRFATPYMVEEFGFSKLQISGMISAWSVAYGTGQLVNGLITDRIGGKTAMLIGASGTVIVNLVFGFASFAGTFSTFALPDLRGRAPMQHSQGPGLTNRVQGESGGSASVTLIQSEIPAHDHVVSFPVISTNATTSNPENTLPARTLENAYGASGTPAEMAPALLGITGSSLPHNNRQPYLTVSFIIALQGIFPPRS